MAYGLLVENDAGQLVVDAEARGLHYVGQAAYTGDVGGSSSFFYIRRARRQYSITLPSAEAVPAVTIRPTTDRWMSVYSVRRQSAGSSTWLIEVYSASSAQLAFNETDMLGTSSADVHVFSTGVTSTDGWGMRIYDAAGNVAWDFGAKPLFLKLVLEFPQRTDRATYRDGDALAHAGVSQPLLVEAGSHGKDNVAIGAVGTHHDSEYVYQLDGAGSLRRVLLGTFRERGEDDGSPYTPQPDWALPAHAVYVVDLADYA